MRGNAQPDGRPFGGSELRSYVSPFVELSLPVLCGSVHSLQRRFPIDDVLLRSGDICDEVAKICEIAPKF